MKPHTTSNPDYKSDLVADSSINLLDAAYRRKKLVIWTIRTIITIVLYIIFWKHDWVKWSLLLVVPLNLFNLFMLVIYPKMMKRKINKAKERLEQLQKK